MYWLSPIELNVFCRSWGDSSCRLPCLEEDSDCGVSLFSHLIYNNLVTAAWFFSLPPIFFRTSPLEVLFLFAKFGRFTPNRLALIGQKYALIGHFHFCRLALIGHGHFRKSLIMNKSSWKYGSFPKICKQLAISLIPFSGYIFSIFLPAVFKTNQSTKLPVITHIFLVFAHIRPRPTALSSELRLNIHNFPLICT